MAKYVDTEPYLLLTGAKNDIIDIHSSLVNEMFSVEEKSHKICFNATRAAEKTLKGYIRFIDDKTDVKLSHDLDYLYNIVLKLNSNFTSIKNDLDKLDNYKSWTGYEPHTKIEKHEVIDVLKSLKNIYNFPPLKEARNTVHKQHNFNTLPDTIMDTLLNIATNNKTLICYKHKIIDQNKHSTFENMKLKHISNYNKYLSKYTKTSSAGKQIILCRNLDNNIKELFFIDRDFDQKQAECFIKEWDKNNNQKK